MAHRHLGRAVNYVTGFTGYVPRGLSERNGDILSAVTDWPPMITHKAV
jgi:hypothetical protein